MTAPTREPRDVLAELVPLEGRTVVDVGCGGGGLVRWMTARGAHATGVETQPEVLARARAAGGGRFLEGTAQAMPLPDASADAVTFVHSLHHVPGDALDAALAEAARVLRPGGLLYVQEPLADGPHFELLRPVDDETAVRAAAQAALRRVPDRRLERARELEFDTVVSYRDFAAYRDTVVAADGERAAFFAAHDAELRAHFAAAGGDGAPLRQPTRVDLLRRPAAG